MDDIRIIVDNGPRSKGDDYLEAVEVISAGGQRKCNIAVSEADQTLPDICCISLDQEKVLRLIRGLCTFVSIPGDVEYEVVKKRDEESLHDRAMRFQKHLLG